MIRDGKPEIEISATWNIEEYLRLKLGKSENEFSAAGNIIKNEEGNLRLKSQLHGV